jgi:ribosomal-protein-alanine N-acetyltransferase
LLAPIESRRLKLVPMDPHFLRTWLEGDVREASRLIGATVPALPEGVAPVLKLRLQQLEQDPSLQPWLLRAMTLISRSEMIGHIGFHTTPGAKYLDKWHPGAIEFGFQVYHPHRRQGYALEASKAMMNWAREARGVTRFVLTISPDNTASQALAKRLGFVRVGEHTDDIDGVEDVLAYTSAVSPNSALQRTGRA